MGKYGIAVKSWWGACGCPVYFSPLFFCMLCLKLSLIYSQKNLYYLLTAFYVPDSSAGYWTSIMSRFHNNPARTIKPSSFKHGRTEAQGHPVGRRQSLTLNLVCLMPDTHTIYLHRECSPLPKAGILSTVSVKMSILSFLGEFNGWAAFPQW